MKLPTIFTSWLGTHYPWKVPGGSLGEETQYDLVIYFYLDREHNINMSLYPKMLYGRG